MVQRAFKLPGGRPEEQDTCPKEQPVEVAARVISYPEVAPVIGTMCHNYHRSVLTLYLLYLSGLPLEILQSSGSEAYMSYMDLCMPSQV